VPVSIDAVNGSGRARVIDRGDEIRYTYSTPLKSTSLTDWGISNDSVRIELDNRSSPNGDVISIYPRFGGSATPLGTIDAKANYADGSDRTFTGTIDLRTGNTVVEVEVGSSISGLDPVGTTRMTWTPTAGVFDSLGAPCATTAVTQPTAKSNF
jgi:hypothetical protein